MSLMDRKEIPVNRKNLNVLRRNQDRHTPDIMEIPGEVRKPDNYMETPDAPKSLEYQPEERIFDPRPGGDQRPKSEANRNQFQIPEKPEVQLAPPYPLPPRPKSRAPFSEKEISLGKTQTNWLHPGGWKN